MWWTVRQIVDTFGRDAVSAGIRANYDSGQLDLEYEIVHAIEPNPNAPAPRCRGDAQSVERPSLRSPAVPLGVVRARAAGRERSLLRVSGYAEFPCMAPRWDVVGSDTWGSGPGWMALGDAQQLQIQQRRKLEAIDKQVKPPMVGPPSLQERAGDACCPAASPMSPIRAARASGRRSTCALDLSASRARTSPRSQGRVKEAFYANLFLMMAECDRREITAREIDERREEKMLMLGPVLERLHDELLSPLVARVFNIMARNGQLPEPPRGLGSSGCGSSASRSARSSPKPCGLQATVHHPATHTPATKTSANLFELPMK